MPNILDQHRDHLVDRLKQQGFSAEYPYAKVGAKRNVLLEREGETEKEKVILTLHHPYRSYPGRLEVYTRLAKEATSKGIAVLPVFRKEDFPELQKTGRFRKNYGERGSHRIVDTGRRVKGLIKVVAAWRFSQSPVHFLDLETGTIRTYVFDQNLYNIMDVQRSRTGELIEIPEFARGQDLKDIVQARQVARIEGDHIIDLESGPLVSYPRIRTTIFTDLGPRLETELIPTPVQESLF